MTDLEVQAMLIRAEYARDVAVGVSEEERYELLFAVLRPSPVLLSGSLARAEEEGVSNLARSIAAGVRARDSSRMERTLNEKGLTRDERPAPVRAPGAPIVWATP